MKHDVVLANKAGRLLEIGEQNLNREVSGPPMIKMVSVAMATGFLLALLGILVFAIDQVTGIGIGWCASLAVLAIEAGLYSRSSSLRLASRRCVFGWSTSSAAS